MPPSGALEHVLVAALPVVAGGRDLDLASVHVRVGVDDQRAELAADLEHDELRVRPIRVPLVVRVVVVVLVVVVLVTVVVVPFAHLMPPEARSTARRQRRRAVG